MTIEYCSLQGTNKEPIQRSAAHTQERSHHRSIGRPWSNDASGQSTLPTSLHLYSAIGTGTNGVQCTLEKCYIPSSQVVGEVEADELQAVDEELVCVVDVRKLSKLNHLLQRYCSKEKDAGPTQESTDNEINSLMKGIILPVRLYRHTV